MSRAGELLVVNVGSSSVKLALLDPAGAVLAARDLNGAGDDATLPKALAGFAGVPLVGHRIVHGGAHFQTAAVVDDQLCAALAELTPLAPLHQPPGLAALDAARSALPDATHVACFDTAFHSTLPAAASTYAVPADWREGLGVRRYGFHGLSHAYAARRAAAVLGRSPATLRTVTCHLGAGASLCAVRGGVSVDTTMGFTPLEGLPMATRSGSVDPGLVLWLIREAGLEPAAVEDALERRSGLLGLTGTADMREVEERARHGEAASELALAVYAHRLRAAIAAMTASLGGLDALVFTGGVGERSPAVRRTAAATLEYLGIELDDTRNEAASGDPDGDIASAAARVRTVVVRAREDLEIARQTRALTAA
ncbi:MAG: acetate kinase [Gaiellales bacterium]|nr:acetate kinase [Gaiellales bacterium]